MYAGDEYYGDEITSPLYVDWHHEAQSYAPPQSAIDLTHEAYELWMDIEDARQATEADYSPADWKHHARICRISARAFERWERRRDAL